MAERVNDDGGLREQAERLALAAIGAVALTRERIDELHTKNDNLRQKLDRTFGRRLLRFGRRRRAREARSAADPEIDAVGPEGPVDEA